MKIWGSQMKIWGSPMKIWGSPIKIWGSPMKIWGFPMKIWGSQMKIWGVSKENLGVSNKNRRVFNENLGVSQKNLGVSSKTPMGVSNSTPMLMIFSQTLNLLIPNPTNVCFFISQHQLDPGSKTFDSKNLNLKGSAILRFILYIQGLQVQISQMTRHLKNYMPDTQQHPFIQQSSTVVFLKRYLRICELQTRKEIDRFFFKIEKSIIVRC